MSRPHLLLVALLLAPACGSAVAPVAPLPPPPPPPAVATAAPEPPPAPSFVVRGRVLGHDGKPMKLAHVHLGHETTPVGEDGAFRLVRTEPGFEPVRVTGVDHAERFLGVLFDAGEQQVEIELGTYERTGLDGAIVVLHRGAVRQRRALTKKGADGTLTAEISADGTELAYQIAGVFGSRIVNGPEADGFAYDGDGDYLSLLHPQAGKLVLRIDPARLPPSGAQAEVRFADPASRTARIARLYDEASRRMEDVEHPADPSWRAKIAAALVAERDPDVLAALRIAYLVPPPAPGSDEAAGVARALLDGLAAGSSLWRFRPEAAITAAGLAARGSADDAYLDALLDGLHDRDVAAGFMSARVRAASSAGRELELARLYPVLKERFGDTAAAQSVALLDPARRVRPGKQLPDFALPSLPDPSGAGRPVTPARLRGKVVLIDFWGTWCMPCRNEMPFLTQAFEAHKRDGFTIVSIAAHDKLRSVQNFRAGLFKMPWTHVVLDAKNQKATLELFENQGFPEPILVDGEGKILALGEALRGRALEPAIARALAARAKAGPQG